MSNELSIFEAMGGTYRKVDGILYPNISECSDNTLSVTITDVGKYGLIWISYMKENHIDRYSHHIRMGLLQRKAQEVNEEAYEMLLWRYQSFKGVFHAAWKDWLESESDSKAFEWWWGFLQRLL